MTRQPDPAPPARPVLKPALRRLWRDATTLQLGIDPARAVVLSGVGATECGLLDTLDGSRDAAGVANAAATLGVPERAARRLVTLLARSHALDDASGERAALAELDPDERERLRPELATLSLVHDAPGAATRVLTERRERIVLVRGAGRVGATLATLLAASGVGRVATEDPGAARPADAVPAGVTTSDTGWSRERAAEHAVRRAAPSTETGPLLPSETPDVVVLADDPIGAAAQDTLLRGHAPHLYAGIRETTGVVGPFVVVGTSPCQRCIDLARAERDPAWPWLVAQLAGRGRRPTDAGSVVLASLVATLTAHEVLTFLDGAVVAGPSPATLGGTLEMTLPDWRVRRRSWSVHPGCGCSWRA